MDNLFLDLKSTDTFETALERLEEHGVVSVMFTAKDKDKPLLFLCVTQDPELAVLLRNTADAYTSEQANI